MTCNSPRNAAVLQQARTALLTAVLTAAVAAAIPSAAAAAQDGQVTFTKDIAPILVEIPAGAPAWWGPIGDVPVGLTEDRYVAAVEMREVNDLQGRIGGQTVGGRVVFHHLCWGMVAADGKWFVRATFSSPGTYVLRCLAHDGGLMTSEDVTFVVSQ